MAIQGNTWLYMAIHGNTWIYMATAGLKCRSQVTGYGPQATGQFTGQVTGHRSQVTKTIGHWTKLFWTDVLLYKNIISQGTLMVVLSYKQY